MNQGHWYCPVKIIADKVANNPHISHEEILENTKKHLLITFPDKDLNKFNNMDKLYENAALEWFINTIVNVKNNQEIEVLWLHIVHKQDLVTINIHGSNNWLSYYNKEDKKIISLWNLKNDKEWLDKLSESLQNILQERAKIFLLSCKTFKKWDNKNTVSNYIHHKTWRSIFWFSKLYTPWGMAFEKNPRLKLCIGSVENMFIIDEENNLCINKEIFKEYFSIIFLLMSLMVWMGAWDSLLSMIKSFIEYWDLNHLKHNPTIEFVYVLYASVMWWLAFRQICHASVDIDIADIKENLYTITRLLLWRQTWDALLEDNSKIKQK